MHSTWKSDSDGWGLLEIVTWYCQGSMWHAKPATQGMCRDAYVTQWTLLVFKLRHHWPWSGHVIQRHCIYFHVYSSKSPFTQCCVNLMWWPLFRHALRSHAGVRDHTVQPLCQPSHVQPLVQVWCPVSAVVIKFGTWYETTCWGDVTSYIRSFHRFGVFTLIISIPNILIQNQHNEQRPCIQFKFS